MADVLKTARTTAKSQFTRAEKKMKERLTAQPPVPVETIKRCFAELSAKWTKVQDSHDAYVETILEGADEDVLANEEQWIDDLSGRFDGLEIEVDKYMEKLQKKAPAEDESTDEDDEPVRNSSNMLKLDRIKLPPFDGNIRKYPDFKSTFIKHVQIQYTTDQQALVLRNHLVDAVREEVSNAGDDCDKLWERLDQKYGNAGKLIDAILFEIKSLSLASSDQTTLNMINIIEKAHLDLQQLGEQNEMYNVQCYHHIHSGRTIAIQHT